MTAPYLIVGLGNPGPDYSGHRHNVGFMALDVLASTARADTFTKKFHGEVAQAELKVERSAEAARAAKRQGSAAGEGGASPPSIIKLILLKPLTYMNNSGRAVQAAAAFYKIPPENIIVLHDELDLPVGKLRIKKGGGANGQNGVRDIDAAIGKEYWRIRLGINHPGDKEKVHGHVLSNFSKDDRLTTYALLDALARYFHLFFEHSPEALMSKVTDTLAPPREKKEKPAMDKPATSN